VRVNSVVTPADMVEAYGLRNVVYFPQCSIGRMDSESANLLSHVGLPHSEAFSVRADCDDPYEPGVDPITLGGRCDHYGWPCPPEARSWWMLGYLFTSLIALDPASGKVYAFPEGPGGYVLLHRNVESLAYSLIQFRKLEVDHDNDVDPEELAKRFKCAVGVLDPTPFADENSQWNVSLEELEHGIW
jgi:hypothetical protein